MRFVCLLVCLRVISVSKYSQALFSLLFAFTSFLFKPSTRHSLMYRNFFIVYAQNQQFDHQLCLIVDNMMIMLKRWIKLYVNMCVCVIQSLVHKVKRDIFLIQHKYFSLLIFFGLVDRHKNRISIFCKIIEINCHNTNNTPTGLISLELYT